MPYFDRWDVCEAYYLFGVLFHSGQGSKEYLMLSRLSRLGFRPRKGLEPSTLSENGREIFGKLLRGKL